MDNLNQYRELEKLLRNESEFCTEDGHLLKNAIVEAALAMRPKLLRLLMSNEALRNNFFVEVDGITIFDKVRFQKFVMNKRFLPDSYSCFKNKIGLVDDNGNFIADSREVVLAWPFKDCILEGGQTREDAKRNEVFWNEILAPDEINRLTEPKVLNNFKYYDSEGEHEVSKISPKDNLIIKGNNLLILHSLKKRYRGKIKLIFIDPPYNTGNDSFGYNDSFNHSTWLTFTKNRLQVAYELLSSDGTMCVMIDHNELPYCMAILDEIFGKENLRNIITVKRGSVTGAKVINQGVVNLSDYALIYSKSAKWNPNRVYRARQRDERYNSYIDNFEENYKSWRTIPIMDAFADSKQIKKKDLKKVYGDDLERSIDQFVIDNADRVVQFATLDDNNISYAARELKRESIANPTMGYLLEREGRKPYYVFGGRLMLFAKDRLIEVDGQLSFSEPISDIWDDVLPNDLHNEGGVIFKKGKKPEKLLHRIIELCTKERDIVLDYHLGSGTTAAVALKMNRRFIGAEQMDYGNNDCVRRLCNVIGHEEDGCIVGFDTRGISNAVNWKGGGSFVCCELATANQRFVEQIEGASSNEELTNIWKDMQRSGFLSWKIQPKQIDEHASDFAALSINDQKRFLIECLDKNLLYVPLSEIDNEEFAISDEDKKLNMDFYSVG